MVMLGGRLVLMVVLGQAPSAAVAPSTASAPVSVSASASVSAPKDLVAQLGANRYAEREAAARALEDLGGAALPALRAAHSSRDPEVRQRARRVVLKIERALLVQPSKARLEFRDASVHEVVRSLSEQTGCNVELTPETHPAWKTRRVTLSTPGELPFWQALDRFCDAAQLRYNPDLMPAGNVFNAARAPIALFDGPTRMAMPISDHGPFRVILMGLDYQRHVNYAVLAPRLARPLPPVRALRPGPAQPRRIAGPVVVVDAVPPPPPEPVVNVQFAANLVVAAEPRLSMRENGAVRLIEAVDDRGNSLVVPEPHGDRPGRAIERSAGYLGIARGEHGARFHARAALRRPDAPGRRVKVLRGAVPVVVSSRRPDPLVVPLDRGAGRRVEGADVAITLHEVRAVAATRQVFIELSVQSGATGPNHQADTDVEVFHQAQYTEAQKLQMEVLDAKGRAVPWFVSSVDAERSRLTLTLLNVPTAAPVKELRYHSLTRAAVEIPFEFRDFVMP